MHGNEFDLDALDPTFREDVGEWMQVKHPVTGEDLAGMRILVASFDSEKAKEHKRGVQARRLRMLDRDLTPDELKRESLALLDVVTIGWENVKAGGVMLERTRANVIMVYERFDWLRKQVDKFAGDLGNFLPPSSSEPTSSPTPTGTSASVPPAQP